MEKPGVPSPATPTRSKDFEHLPLMALRQYRRALTQEESRVSYWRRILQARLDNVRAGETGSPANLETLRPMLTEAKVGAGRRALVEVVPVEDIPPLPDLAELWERQPIPGNTEHNAALLRHLVKAEAQLSAYRLALHRRLASATTELIARYREEPALCLSALPVPPARSSAAESRGA